ncbi:MAG TPA: hypothetical protein DIW43_18290 [Spongiibacteraceae bacterium]|mgnify:FL=1|nr:hypothetical protein [Spongiibacteraceae bacterium]HCS29411.1 hypothetical protein [Spongiibacteraceae bacterium]
MNWLFLLSFITASISMLFALVFLTIYWQRPDLPATRCWGIAYLLLVVAMGTVGLRIGFPDVDPHIFSNMLAVTAGLACFYVYKGIRCWREVPPYSGTFTGAVILTISLLAFMGYLNNALEPVSLFAARLYIGLFSGLAVYTLLTGPKAKNSGHYLSALFLAANPVTQIVSLYILFFIPSIPDGIAATSIEELSNSRLAAVNFVGLPISFTAIALFCLLGVLLELGQQLRDESLRDWLTGTFNRRGFVDVAEKSFALSKRRGSDLSLILFDMDNFKSINDRYGHDAGDLALKWVSRLLQERLRTSDLVARWGGEEFIVLLPDAAEQDALRIAEDIRQHLQRRPLAVTDKSEVVLSASFGVAQRTAADTRIDSIVTRADYALYQSKHEGKNRVNGSSALVAPA